MNTNLDFLRSACRVLFVLVISISLICYPTNSVSAGGALTVTSNGDASDGNPGDGYCDTGAGWCTLRAAIQEANAFPGTDSVIFSFSGTITLTSTLPGVTGDISIDGSGQNVTISGNNLYHVMYINAGVSVSLSYLNIMNGSQSSGSGGAIFNYGALTVSNCTFSSNSAQNYGGAIYNGNVGTLTVMNSTFYGNSVSVGGGGAIYNSASSVTITNSTFDSNTASLDGGAIESYAGTLTVTNSTFYYNTATSYGGGIENDQGTLVVTNSTFSDNGANITGGGIDGNLGTLYLKNTILANSTSGGDCASTSTLVADINNLIEINSGCGTPVSSSDPYLGLLLDNGGPTYTMALQPGSPAIDTGDDATCAASPVNYLDQRGTSRSYGAHCDIGAYELMKGSLTVRSAGAYDGHILESGENTNIGGTRDSTLSYFNLGDDAGDRQYRAILSFGTAAIPDTAVITRVTLKIRKQGQVGSNPFTFLGGLKVDIRKPFFGTSVGLVVGDFQAAAGKSAVATFGATPVAYWYSAVFGLAGYPYINKTGTTQIRLRFYNGDNDDGGADYMAFYSGNYTLATSRPTLVIEYYVP